MSLSKRLRSIISYAELILAERTVSEIWEINIISMNLLKYYYSALNSAQQPRSRLQDPYSRFCWPRQERLQPSLSHSRSVTWHHLMNSSMVKSKTTRSNKSQETRKQRRLAREERYIQIFFSQKKTCRLHCKQTNIYFAFLTVTFLRPWYSKIGSFKAPKVICLSSKKWSLFSDSPRRINFYAIKTVEISESRTKKLDWQLNGLYWFFSYFYVYWLVRIRWGVIDRTVNNAAMYVWATNWNSRLETLDQSRRQEKKTLNFRSQMN